MKKLLILILCALSTATVSAQYIMVVEQESGATTEYNVDDIHRVYFKSSDSGEASTSELSCRLKDKNGNPVLLTLCDNTGFDYDEKGRLTSFGNLDDSDRTFFIDGLSYTRTEDPSKHSSPSKTTVRLELNGDGLISKAIFSREDVHSDGSLGYLIRGEAVFSYNSQKQLSEMTYSAYAEDYADKVKTYTAHGTVVNKYTWDGGNLVKVDVESEVSENKHGTESTDTSSRTLSFVYSNNANPTKQYMNGLSENIIDAGSFGLRDLCLIGLFGVGPANLLSKSIIEGRSTTDYTYTLNENGTIATENSWVYEYK